MREKVRPKLGKIDIDYQKLHDAFFKWQTKPSKYNIVDPAVLIQFDPIWFDLIRFDSKVGTIAINELLCLKNAGAQISMFFTSNE